MSRKAHVRCGVGEKLEITSKAYLSLFCDRNGIYYGVNQISKNIIVGNRKKLLNGNGFIFGVSGAGKSFQAKMEMGSVLLSTDDNVIAVDPMNGAKRSYLKRVDAIFIKLYA